MRYLDLTTIAGERTPLSRTWPGDALPPPDRGDYRVVGDVRLDAEVGKAGDEYRLVGTLTTELDVPCSRCLEPYRVSVRQPFDLLYVPRRRNRGEGEREIAEEDLAIAFHDGEAVDLGELAREQCYLALPMKPLCGEACRGLCPVCGTDLNVAACECRTDWLDPRLEPLRRLRLGH